MSSLENALRILNRFSPSVPVQGVMEVSRDLDMSKSSVSRLMKTMSEAGLISQRSERRDYEPGPLAFRLGNLYRQSVGGTELVDAAMSKLIDEFGLTGYVGVLKGTDVVLIRVRQGSYPIRLVLGEGTSIPAHVTAIGLALLARRTDTQIRRLYPEEIYYGETGEVASAERIIARVQSIRKDGYAMVEGMTYKGFNALASAVHSADADQAIGFSLSYPENLLGGGELGRIAERLVEEAGGIGRRLGDPYWHGHANEPADQHRLKSHEANGEAQ